MGPGQREEQTSCAYQTVDLPNQIRVDHGRLEQYPLGWREARAAAQVWTRVWTRTVRGRLDLQRRPGEPECAAGGGQGASAGCLAEGELQSAVWQLSPRHLPVRAVRRQRAGSSPIDQRAGFEPP